MDKIERLKARILVLEKDMHEAPLNKVFQTHDGHRHLGTFSRAWASRSREWTEARKELASLQR